MPVRVRTWVDGVLGTFVSNAFEASACSSVLGGLACCERVVSAFSQLVCKVAKWEERLMGGLGRMERIGRRDAWCRCRKSRMVED